LKLLMQLLERQLVLRVTRIERGAHGLLLT
jgi:hypothetical protein